MQSSSGRSAAFIAALAMALVLIGLLVLRDQPAKRLRSARPQSDQSASEWRDVGGGGTIHVEEFVISCGIPDRAADDMWKALIDSRGTARYAMLQLEADQTVDSKLARRENFSFPRKTPLSDALAYVSDVCGANISFEPETMPVLRKATAWLDGRDVTPAATFDALLAPYGLSWRIRGGRVVVVEEGRDAAVATRVYDIRPITLRLLGDRRPAVAEPASPEITELVDALQLVGRWKDRDGDGGTMDVSSNFTQLVVRHTHRIHAEMAGLIDILRSADVLTARATRDEPPGLATAGSLAELSLHAKLQQPLSVDYHNDLLSDVLEDLRRRIGVPWAVDWLAIQRDRKADPSSLRVTHSCRDVPAFLVVDAIARGMKLRTDVRDGALWIDAGERTTPAMTTVVYPVHWLTRPGAVAQLSTLLQRSTPGPWLHADGEGGDIVSLPRLRAVVVLQNERNHRTICGILWQLRKRAMELNRKQEARSDAVAIRFYPIGDEARARSIAKAIVQLVEPKSWIPSANPMNTGSQPAIHVIGDTLVVRQAEWIHLRITKFLDELDRAENGE